MEDISLSIQVGGPIHTGEVRDTRREGIRHAHFAQRVVREIEEKTISGEPWQKDISMGIEDIICASASGKERRRKLLFGGWPAKPSTLRRQQDQHRILLVGAVEAIPIAWKLLVVM